ncbi:MAG: 7TM diverse intracellular signaling domain-containing protein [Bacteroidia bacterium]
MLGLKAAGTVALLFIIHSISGQPPVNLRVNKVAVNGVIDVAGFYSFSAVPDSVTAQELQQQLINGKGEYHQGTVYSSGYTESVTWLAIPLINLESKSLKMVFEAGDPHIDKLDLYKSITNKMEYLGNAGDLMPFYDRLVSNHNFVFQFTLDSAEAAVLLLRIDNKGHTAMMPFSIEIFDEHYGSAVASYLVWGLLTGILLFVCVFSLFIWLSVREKLFFFYSLYIIVVIMWIWSNNGLGYQFLYPDFPHVMARIRLIMGVFGIALMLHVMQLFVKQDKSNSRFYRFTNIIKFTLSALALILFIPYDYTRDKILITTFLISSDLIALCAIFLLFAGLIEKIRQGYTMAYTYLIAVSVFFVASIVTLLIRLGVVPATALSLNGIYISILAEILILAIALGQRYSSLKKEEQRLQQEIENQKLETAHQVEMAAVMERNRIAADLHDEIGSGISGLRMFSEMAEKKNTIEELKSDTVRISETAAILANKIKEVVWTLDAENKNLEDFLLYIQKYGMQFFDNSSITFSMEIPIEVPYIQLNADKQKQLLLAMKEIFNNALKHSEASKLTCKVEINESLKISVKDNGKGFTNASVVIGSNGLNNIKNRISAIGGNMELHSENGVTYMLHLPV